MSLFRILFKRTQHRLLFSHWPDLHVQMLKLITSKTDCHAYLGLNNSSPGGRGQSPCEHSVALKKKGILAYNQGPVRKKEGEKRKPTISAAAACSLAFYGPRSWMSPRLQTLRIASLRAAGKSNLCICNKESYHETSVSLRWLTRNEQSPPACVSSSLWPWTHPRFSCIFWHNQHLLLN